jgi:hypothetical protein
VQARRRGTAVAPSEVRQVTISKDQIMAKQLNRFRTRLVTLAVAVAPFAMVTTAIA